MVASVCAAAAGANHVWQTRSVAKATALETIDRKRIGPRSMRFEPSRNRCMVRMPTLPDVLAHTSHEKCQPAYKNRAELRELIGMPSYGAPEIRREVCAGSAFCRRRGIAASTAYLPARSRSSPRFCALEPRVDCESYRRRVVAQAFRPAVPPPSSPEGLRLTTYASEKLLNAGALNRREQHGLHAVIGMRCAPSAPAAAEAEQIGDRWIAHARARHRPNPQTPRFL